MTLKTLTRDHLIPKSKGGRGVRNIVAACIHCNTKKGSKACVPPRYMAKKRRQYFRSLGVWCKKPRGEWNEIMPNFGKGTDGASLWAPQYGIV